MANPLDFFDGTKIMKPWKIHRSARKRSPVSRGIGNCSLSGSMQSLAPTIDSGTDYVEEYIQKERDQIFEVFFFY